MQPLNTLGLEFEVFINKSFMSLKCLKYFPETEPSKKRSIEKGKNMGCSISTKTGETYPVYYSVQK
jgi:hypothetical protein